MAPGGAGLKRPRQMIISSLSRPSDLATHILKESPRLRMRRLLLLHCFLHFSKSFVPARRRQPVPRVCVESLRHGKPRTPQPRWLIFIPCCSAPWRWLTHSLSSQVTFRIAFAIPLPDGMMHDSLILPPWHRGPVIRSAPFARSRSVAIAIHHFTGGRIHAPSSWHK